jgi:hypothetical protein
VKRLIPGDIIRHFSYVACCLHVSEDGYLPSKRMARVNGKESFNCVKGEVCCICCDWARDAIIKEN